MYFGTGPNVDEQTNVDKILVLHSVWPLFTANIFALHHTVSLDSVESFWAHFYVTLCFALSYLIRHRKWSTFFLLGITSMGNVHFRKLHHIHIRSYTNAHNFIWYSQWDFESSCFCRSNQRSYMKQYNARKINSTTATISLAAAVNALFMKIKFIFGSFSGCISLPLSFLSFIYGNIFWQIWKCMVRTTEIDLISLIELIKMVKCFIRPKLFVKHSQSVKPRYPRMQNHFHIDETMEMLRMLLLSFDSLPT